LLSFWILVTPVSCYHILHLIFIANAERCEKIWFLLDACLRLLLPL